MANHPRVEPGDSFEPRLVVSRGEPPNRWVNAVRLVCSGQAHVGEPQQGLTCDIDGTSFDDGFAQGWTLFTHMIKPSGQA